MSLRKAFAVVALATIALMVLEASAVIVLGTELHAVATSLDVNLESVRVAKRLRIEMLETDVALARSGSATAPEAWASAHALQELLEEAEEHVQTAEEARLLERARRRIAAVQDVAPRGGGPELAAAMDAAHRALRDLVEHNLALARTVRERARWWNSVASVTGTALAACIVGTTIVLLFWGRRHVVEPLVALRTFISGFGLQHGTGRLAPRGPAELQEVAAAFNAVADELARQRSERLAMLGGVAHDLRNPLSVLSVATGQLAGERALPPEPRLREILAMVARQVRHLDRMVGDFLDASRVEAGAFELRLEDVDVRSAAENVADLYRSGHPNRHIALSLPEAPVLARCDPLRIEQALGNLVSNALKYSPQEAWVELSVTERGDREEVVIAVVDGGVGLSEEEVRRLFQPFSRVGSLRERIPGMGLGLATTARIVSAHGGRIEVTSTPGKGARFEIRLPGARGSAATSSGEDRVVLGAPHESVLTSERNQILE